MKQPPERAAVFVGDQWLPVFVCKRRAAELENRYFSLVFRFHFNAFSQAIVCVFSAIFSATFRAIKTALYAAPRKRLSATA